MPSSIHPGLILKAHLRVAKSQGRPLSLRGLARRSGLSPSLLSQIFSEKKLPSSATLKTLAKVLNLSLTDRTELENSLIHKSLESRGLLGPVIKRDFPRGREKSFRQGSRSLPDHLGWLDFAVLEMLSFAKPLMEKELAEKLGVSVFQVKTSLDRLFDIKLIARQQGRWKKSEVFLEYIENRTHASTRKYHQNMLSKAIEIMNSSTSESEVLRRRITGATVAVNSSKVEWAVDQINQFMWRVIEEVSKEPCDQVYQLGLVFVPLTKAGSK